MIIMTTEAFWAKDWDEEETYNRILSASAVIMIMDKMNKVPVGFGRIFMMRNNNNNEEETLGYLSDVAVNIQHQNKGSLEPLFCGYCGFILSRLCTKNIRIFD
ncbi:unnamed protein product [Rotaria sp. Silwood1]|nr:unnamed protein product [Rotaria sp. Silwood1]